MAAQSLPVADRPPLQETTRKNGEWGTGYEGSKRRWLSGRDDSVREIPRSARNDGRGDRVGKNHESSGCLFLLDFDRVRQMHGASHFFSDGQILTVLDVAGERARLQPFETPSIFDRDNRVAARYYA